MKTLTTWLLLALLAVAVQPAFGRGGGGCFEQGTRILTPHGPVAIETLHAGDTVWSVTEGGLHAALVQAIFEVRPEEIIELSAAGRTLRVTREHPFETAAGVFRRVDEFQKGDTLTVWDGSTLRNVPIESLRRIATTRPAYNLLVSPGGTFLADGIVVHNKGCFLPDTPILRADGTELPIRDVRPGDELMAFTADGQFVHTRVRSILTHDVDEYLEVATDKSLLRVTVEHPFYVGDGTFKTLEALDVGDTVFAYDGQGLGAQRIVSIARIRAHVRVYNLQTDAPNTFFANRIAVHNKGGGCFPQGTPVLTPHGEVPIEQLRIGDSVVAVLHNGRTTETQVEAVYETRTSLLAVETDRGTLRTTAEHPLELAAGGFENAGDCVAGDQVLTWHDGQLEIATIWALTAGADDQTVYNVRVGAPHTFIAGGFVVHNKGGGGGFGGGFHGGGYHGGSGGGGSPALILFIVIFIVVVFVVVANQSSRSSSDENLDYVYSQGAVARKADKTQKLIEFIARTDSTFNEQALKQRATDTFTKLQQWWQARDYGPMQPLMMPDLYQAHCAQLDGLRRDHEIDKIENLHVDRVDIVNIRYTQKAEGREYTALITATAQDYYVDDRNGNFLRGDHEPAQFQEFWTFQLHNGTWLLREIDQTKESDALKEENFFEPFTEKGVDQVYGKTAGQEGPAGPWVETSTETKATRIERLLNFLVQTDKLWDRQAMLERARQVFLDVMLAREAGDVTKVKDDELFPVVAADLKGRLHDQQVQGLRVEYLNLCVRKAELILVRNYTDNTQDEFTVRISAHAQKIVSRNGAVTSQDEFVTPFMEYWTFGRLDGQWKLKEVLPPARGEELVGQENVDQDSNAAQLQWYYQHKRAT